MKKQLTLISAVAAAFLSAQSYAETFPTGTLSGAATDAINTITGSNDQYIKSDYQFNLSNTVELRFIQNAGQLAATAASGSGKSVYGSSSGAGTISQCRLGAVAAAAAVDEVLDPITGDVLVEAADAIDEVIGGDPLSSIGDPTVSNGCAGAS